MKANSVVFKVASGYGSECSNNFQQFLEEFQLRCGYGGDINIDVYGGDIADKTSFYIGSDVPVEDIDQFDIETEYFQNNEK